MKRWLWIAVILAAVAAGVWFGTRGAAPAEVPFAKAKRETLVSVLSPNGKVEPLEWAPAHAVAEGRLAKVVVERGQTVAQGAVLAVLDNANAEAELAAAQARLEQARADLGSLKAGGRASELAELDGTLRRLKLDLEAAQRESAALARLVEKKAAPKAELDTAKDRVGQVEALIQTTSARRAALVSQGDVTAAQARVEDAKAAVEQAKRHMADTTIRAPRAGVVYDLPAKAGTWISAGDLIARVGDTSRLKVVVYVDEPDLGRIRAGLPVTVTWDAKPGREWQATVDQVPTQVIALGTRQVGEVAAIAANPEHDLPPGANINVRIRAQVVEGALTVPKSALQRVDGVLGVFALEEGKLAWRKIEIGVSSETRTEVKSGVKESDSVALPSEHAYKQGLAVAAVYPQ